jgi:hypothetical protein
MLFGAAEGYGRLPRRLSERLHGSMVCLPLVQLGTHLLSASTVSADVANDLPILEAKAKFPDRLAILASLGADEALLP